MGEGGEILKGGRAGRARPLGIPWDLAQGGRDQGVRNPWDTGTLVIDV